MELNGNLTIKARMEKVYSFFNDLSKLVPCLPNLVEYQCSTKSARAKFKANIGSIPMLQYLSRVTADVELQILESEKEQIKYHFKGNAAGINYSGDILLKLSTTGDKYTRVDWYAIVDLGKIVNTLLKFVDIDDIVNNIVNDIVNKLSQCIS